MRNSWLEATLIVLGPTVLMFLAYLLSGLSYERFSTLAFIPGMLVEYIFFVMLLVVLRREGRDLATVGWTRQHLIFDVAVGAALGVLLFILVGVVSAGLATLFPTTTANFRASRPAWEGWVYGLGLLTAFAPIEETIWRGYAIPRLTELTGRTSNAVILSSVAFGTLHWWGGLSLMVLTGFAGVAYSMLFLWRRSLALPVVAHFVADFPLFLFIVLDIRPPA